MTNTATCNASQWLTEITPSLQRVPRGQPMLSTRRDNTGRGTLECSSVNHHGRLTVLTEDETVEHIQRNADIMRIVGTPAIQHHDVADAKD